MSSELLAARKQETIKIQEASNTQTTQTNLYHDNTLRFAIELDRYVMFNITELRNTSVESPVYLVYSQCEAILPSCGNQKLSQPAEEEKNNQYQNSTVREYNSVHMCNLKKKLVREGKVENKILQ